MIIPGFVRGICAANNDPTGQRRIKLTIPSLWGTSVSDWAPPCGVDSVPAVGTPVWVGFEMGEAHHPIWIGVAVGRVGGGSSKNGGNLSAPYIAEKYVPALGVVGSGSASAFIAEALAQVGKPYIYGAAGPNEFDCSGLVHYCLNQVGIDNCPRNSEDQWAWCEQSGTVIPEQGLIPGCLIFEQWPGDDPAPGHVVIFYQIVSATYSYPPPLNLPVVTFINSGLVIEAPHTGAFVQVRLWTPGETEQVGYGKVPGLS